MAFLTVLRKFSREFWSFLPRSLPPWRQGKETLDLVINKRSEKEEGKEGEDNGRIQKVCTIYMCYVLTLVRFGAFLLYSCVCAWVCVCV